MKDFDGKWYRYHLEEKEELYEMKNVLWYKTEDEFIPFIIKSDKKVKLLTTRKEYDVVITAVLVDTKDEREVSLPRPNIKGTLKNAINKSGEIFDSAYVLENYYFSEDAKIGVKDWVKGAVRSQEEIFRMARRVNSDFQKQQEAKER